jgi:hypothetical protein
MHLAVAPWLEEPQEEFYSWLYEYAEQGRCFCQVGGLRRNQSTPGAAETGDRESVLLPENEGTLAVRLDVAADVAGAGLTDNGFGGGGELCAKEASHHLDSSSKLDTNTRKHPPDDSLDDEHVGGFGTDTRKRPSDEQLGHETAVDRRPTPASVLPMSNLTANLWVVVVRQGFGLVPQLLLEGRYPEVVY